MSPPLRLTDLEAQSRSTSLHACRLCQREIPTVQSAGRLNTGLQDMKSQMLLLLFGLKVSGSPGSCVGPRSYRAQLRTEWTRVETNRQNMRTCLLSVTCLFLCLSLSWSYFVKATQHDPPQKLSRQSAMWPAGFSVFPVVLPQELNLSDFLRLFLQFYVKQNETSSKVVQLKASGLFVRFEDFSLLIREAFSALNIGGEPPVFTLW